MKIKIGICGFANISENSPLKDLSKQLGKELADNNYNIITGGLGGIMEAVSEGANSSTNKTEIIGVLPNYDKNEANSFVNIAIPTGVGLQRNNILVSSADAIIVIGGGAGTLSEIATAWQMGKLIISLGSEGWGGKLANQQLDHRREDKIYSANTVKEVIKLLQDLLPKYLENKFYGILSPRRNLNFLYTILEKLIAENNPKSVCDYGSGKGELSMLLKSNYNITAYDPLYKNYPTSFNSNINVVDSRQAFTSKEQYKKYDTTVCSLVLCHSLAENEQEAQSIIEVIMQDICFITNSYIYIAICNPLFSNKSPSSIQKRLNSDRYDKNFVLEKSVLSSKNIRKDFHRPMSFYENLFKKFQLNIENIVMTNDSALNKGEIIQNSDFMIFCLTTNTIE